MRWSQTSCPMDSLLNEMETGELLAGRKGAVLALLEPPNPRCRRRRFAALYRGSIWLCEAL
jgi:hypothetical protein